MSTVEEVKARLDIADVVGQYVQLQKAGRNFRALCPFHSEKTPSFFVSPERQTWHCFGACGTGGDVFAFVMRKEGLEFGQTLRLLAEKAGVRLPEWREEAEESGERQRLLAANEAAAQYFHNLIVNSEAGKGAREYLERRGIDSRWTQEFLLGYSLASWDALQRYLGERGFSEDELLAAGLLVEGESGRHDRFRGRLMFPIRDAKGRVTGFGARALDATPPKYLNTPQTAVFDKGSTLYALERARDGIRREGGAVIVEGYMDAIAAHQHGFTNVVASMGTALTERQVRLIKRFAGRIVLALDADAAGSEAALRGQEVVEEALREAGETSVTPVLTWRGLVRYQESVSVDLRVAVLPPGRDPDDVIRSDEAAWRELVAGAKPVLDYKFEAVAARTDSSDPRARSQAVKELAPVVGAIVDPVVRAHYLQRLSRLALVKEEELTAMLARPQRRQARVSTPPQAVGQSDSRRDQREEFLLALLLRYPTSRDQGMEVRPELLWQMENRQVLEAWKQAGDAEALREGVPAELQTHLDGITSLRVPDFGEREAQEALESCVRRLEERQLRLEKQASAAAVASEEEAVGDKISLLQAASELLEGSETPDLQDERVAKAAGRLIEDMAAGLRLHGREPEPKGEDQAENIEVNQ
ncbi:MAG: DNA primase [Chloroflexi bacterium]|nr:DNA primase [Chloroflexota bacterium]